MKTITLQSLFVTWGKIWWDWGIRAPNIFWIWGFVARVWIICTNNVIIQQGAGYLGFGTGNGRRDRIDVYGHGVLRMVRRHLWVQLLRVQRFLLNKIPSLLRTSRTWRRPVALHLVLSSLRGLGGSLGGRGSLCATLASGCHLWTGHGHVHAVRRYDELGRALLTGNDSCKIKK